LQKIQHRERQEESLTTANIFKRVEAVHRKYNTLTLLQEKVKTF
jgi:hypothetical protein